jgi:hypothetical protein
MTMTSKLDARSAGDMMMERGGNFGGRFREEAGLCVGFTQIAAKLPIRDTGTNT